ncbi:hypothetical protein [Gordonia insulae]|uniref:hypothetical protein n=1 Tax=Gordonia insulae TaxID=2420509 RepID=UPI000F5BA579|nr:hypothetical protein [Gordonia insulae]
MSIDAKRRRWAYVVDTAIPGLVFLTGCVLGVCLPLLASTITPQLPVTGAGASAHYNSSISNPPLVFWLIWALVPIIVYGVGGLMFARVKTCRWFLGAFWAGFTPVFIVTAPIVMLIDVGALGSS